MKELALRYLRWGGGLLVLGLLTGYGPLNHYLSGGVEVACPWAPIHGHVVLLGWVGLTLFGLVYRVLDDVGRADALALTLGTIQLWVSILGVLGVWANGIVGYRLLDRLSPDFYYVGEWETLNLWLSIDGAFLTLFTVGCLLHLVVLFRMTRRPAEPEAVQA